MLTLGSREDRFQVMLTLGSREDHFQVVLILGSREDYYDVYPSLKTRGVYIQKRRLVAIAGGIEFVAAEGGEGSNPFQDHRPVTNALTTTKQKLLKF